MKCFVTSRCHSIIQFLLQQRGKVTVKEIAGKFNVSERTIRYDLQLVDSYLKEINVKLMRRPRVGIWIDNPNEAKNKFDDEVDGEDTYRNQVLTKRERQVVLLIHLFNSQGPLTMKELACKLHVSRSTIINDINMAEKWLAERGIGLIRKPNYGVKIICNETAWRKGINDLFLDDFENICAANLLNTTNLDCDNRVDGIISRQIRYLFSSIDIDNLDDQICYIESKLNVRFTDVAYAGLLFHVCVAISRLKQGKRIEMPTHQLAHLTNKKEFRIAQEVCKDIGQAHNIIIPTSEAGYITLHILGSMLREGTVNKETINKEVNSYVRKFIRQISKELGVDLTVDIELKNGLALHIKPALMRLKYNLNIKNPYLNEMKNTYSYLFELCKSVCFESFNEYVFSDDEIGYIAMHIGAALERIKSNQVINTIKVIVVCPTGIGTSALLVSRVRQEYPFIRVLKTVSLLELNKIDLNLVDAIITTVPISKTFCRPVLHVCPFLSKEDEMLIDDFAVKQLGVGVNRYKLEENDLLQIITKSCLVKDYGQLLKDINLFINKSIVKEQEIPLTEILKYLTEDCIKVNVRVDDWQDAVKRGGDILLAKGKIEEIYIKEMIHSCKENNAYIVISPGIALAHASPQQGVNETGISLITLKKPIMFGHPKNDPVRLVVTLAINESRVHHRIMSDLASIFGNKATVQKLIRSESPKELLREIYGLCG